MNSWRREVEILAKEYGATVTVARGGHFHIKHPSTGWRVSCSATPSDGIFALKKIRADIKRAGSR